MIDINILQSLIDWALSHGVRVVLILVAAFILSWIVKIIISKFLREFIKKGVRFNGISHTLNEQRIATLEKVAYSIKKTVIWVIAILTILPEFGINIAPLLAGIGVGGLALGLGARSIIQDYLAGIFILLEDQYRVGEEIEVAGLRGKVKDFNLKRTVIENEEKTLIFIPNSQITKNSNFSRK